jgi:hypothetical protein
MFARSPTLSVVCTLPMLVRNGASYKGKTKRPTQ